MTFGQGLGNYAVDAECVAQNVRTRLQMIQGEWFLDTNAGIPYLQSIMVKPANLPLAEALYKKTILETDGVFQLTAFNMLFDPDLREHSVIVGVETIYGNIEDIRVT